VNSEIYPMRERSMCMGIATAAGWVANLLVSATFLTLESGVSTPGTFWLYGGIAALGALWLWMCMPETANKSLDEIEALFADDGPRVTRTERRDA